MSSPRLFRRRKGSIVARGAVTEDRSIVRSYWRTVHSQLPWRMHEALRDSGSSNAAGRTSPPGHPGAPHVQWQTARFLVTGGGVRSRRSPNYATLRYSHENRIEFVFVSKHELDKVPCASGLESLARSSHLSRAAGPTAYSVVASDPILDQLRLSSLSHNGFKALQNNPEQPCDMNTRRQLRPGPDVVTKFSQQILTAPDDRLRYSLVHLSQPVPGLRFI